MERTVEQLEKRCLTTFIVPLCVLVGVLADTGKLML